MNANTLLIAMVLAMSPMPVLASVVLLTTEHGRPKAVALAGGWFAALAAIGIATVLLAGTVTIDPSSSSGTVSAVLDVALGAAAVVYGLVVRRRAGSGTDATPGWMSRLDHMPPMAAFALGAFLPPYVIVVAGANEILRTDTSSTTRAAATAVFVVVGSLGAILPPLASTGAQGAARIDRWRSWLLGHWQTVLAWLLVVAGVYLLIKGGVELAG
ncbi:MAG: GAP family protein [Microthrixaceae bacterium]